MESPLGQEYAVFEQLQQSIHSVEDDKVSPDMCRFLQAAN